VDASPAVRQVITALGATVASDRWDMTFDLSFTPPPSTAGGAGPSKAMTISGHGTTNVNPFAMVAFSDVPGVGPVTTMMNGSTLWELGGAQYGSAANAGAGTGGSIAGFAPVVEQTLGPQEGAVAMLGLGSATGYLDLVQQAITSASTTGTGTLDGASVTYYQVVVDPTKLFSSAATTPEEAGAVQAALQLLSNNGYRTMQDTVAVDGSGHIRGIVELVTFSDGGVVSEHTTFSNFGCAATVVLPNAASPPTTLAPCKTP
jgi:hypothetical protein